MTTMPQVLRSMNLYVDGQGYAGQVEEITLPKLTIKTEEYRAGGLDAPIEVDMGMEKFEAEFTLQGYDPALLAFWGLSSGNRVNMTLRGAMDDEGEVIAVVVNLHGSWKAIDMGTWKPGEKAALKVQLAATYYQLAVNGVAVIQIDVPNMIRIVNGQDLLSDVRSAIGL